MAHIKFQRDDFNMLYDYLWRDLSMAEHTATNGKNKEIRAAAQERANTIKQVVEKMAIIEHDNLTYSNGKFYRDGIEVR